MTALTPVTLQDYADWLIEELSGFANAGDGATSRDALIANFNVWAKDAARIDPQLAQTIDYVGQVSGRRLTRGEIVSASIDVAGTGYQVGDKFTVDTSTGVGAFVIVTNVDGSGVILAVAVGNAGVDYAAADTATSYLPKDPSNVGAGATISVVVNTNETKLLKDVQAVL